MEYNDSSIVIKKITDYVDIKNTLEYCSDSFYNSEAKSDEFIENYANKFSKYASVYVSLCDEEIVGYISGYMNDYNTGIAYISMIIVKKEHKNKHIGTKLINYFENECKNKGFVGIRLEVANSNENAIRFYCKKGYSFESHKDNSNSFYYKKL